MGFSIETSVPAITVFFQGILSFFSPCILPLVPLYIGYLSGGVWEKNGKKVFINTLFFVLGISTAFFVLGLGATALGEFFDQNRVWFARISGIMMIWFGLYQLGIFGKSKILSGEHRLPFVLQKYAMGPIPALVLGFTFSFAWTPCVGPVLGSVLLMAGSTGTVGRGFILIGVYTLGFVLPFLAVGLFTGKVLEILKKYRNIVTYTVKAGAVLLVLMGIMTLTGLMNGMTNYLSTADGIQLSVQEEPEEEKAPQQQAETQLQTEQTQQTPQPQDEQKVLAPDFTLVDQYGNRHTLSEYKGKTVFLNFWATWCPPCKSEMPEIQELYEEYGANKEEVIILGIAAPGRGQEGDISYITEFLEENGYTFPVVMDETGINFAYYGISAFPTTFMIDKDGAVYGYVEGALTKDIMISIIEQTRNNFQNLP